MKSNYFAVAPPFKLMHSFYGCAIFLPFPPPPENKPQHKTELTAGTLYFHELT